MRFKLLIEYDGTAFKGWQTQKHKGSVQDELERVFKQLYQTDIQIFGSGRTDTGVHARGQVAHVDLPHIDFKEGLHYKLGRMLNEAIVVKEITQVHDLFNARFDAIARKYKYYLSEDPIAIGRPFITVLGRKLDFNLLNLYAKIILGAHDFTTFSKTRSHVEHYMSIVYESNWVYEGNILVYHVKAVRFLRGMVRALVGTMLKCEFYKESPEHFLAILVSQDRSLANVHAPSNGLVLEEVFY